MKKYFAFLALSAMLVSCSDDDTQPVQQDEPFFNLTEGNYWIYKRYGVNDDISVETYMGIDSVRVSGQELIEGNSYYKLEHWTPGNATAEAYLEFTDYVRVNEQGRLVRPNGFVIHPGLIARINIPVQ
jgi:hypothetical protein